jgi:hypothetical protein
MNEKNTNNSQYTDAFPVNDNPTKKEGVTSKDSSRPFDADRKEDPRNKDKGYNSTGTTLNETDKYKK